MLCGVSMYGLRFCQQDLFRSPQVAVEYLVVGFVSVIDSPLALALAFLRRLSAGSKASAPVWNAVYDECKERKVYQGSSCMHILWLIQK